MPRDGAGDYTLPLPDVIEGTTIDSTWANPTMSDIGDTLTDSLDRYGRGGMNVAFLNIDGVVNAPGVAWSNEPQSGWYREALNDVRASINGVDVARFIDASAQPSGSQKPFEIWDGQAFQPPLYGDVTESPTFNSMSSLNKIVIEQDLTVNNNWTVADRWEPLPWGYGAVESNGFLQSGDWNIQSVSYNVVNTGQYGVNFDRGLAGWPTPIVIVSAQSGAAEWRNGVSDGLVDVRTYDLNGNLVNSKFSIMGILVDA